MEDEGDVGGLMENSVVGNLLTAGGAHTPSASHEWTTIFICKVWHDTERVEGGTWLVYSVKACLVHQARKCYVRQAPYICTQFTPETDDTKCFQTMVELACHRHSSMHGSYM